MSYYGNAYELEAEGRAINAEPWEPMPGMAKARCRECLYWFATPKTRPKDICPDCMAMLKRTISGSPRLVGP